MGYLLQKYPRDPFIRGNIFYLKINFGRLLKKSHALNRDKILNKIQEMEEKNPNAFWQLVNMIHNKRDKSEEIEPEIFWEYFKKLSEGMKSLFHDMDFKNKIEKKLKNMKKVVWVNILDKCVT